MSDNEEAAKIGAMFIDWIQVHRESIELFKDFAELIHHNPNDPVHNLEEFNKAMAVQKEASALANTSKAQYNALIEAVDLHLARMRTDVK